MFEMKNICLKLIKNLRYLITGEGAFQVGNPNGARGKKI